jgi:aryl-alcohol dehydrogenase-like predicted oxidoreductase
MKMSEHEYGGKPAYVKQALEASLRRLGTDRIDLYQLHRPDPETPVEDTLGAMEELKREGQASRDWLLQFYGCAASGSGRRFASVQNEYSLVNREPKKEVLPECVRLGIAFIPYFPLASGLLTGKYRKGQTFPKGSRADAGWGPKVFTEQNLERVERWSDVSESHGHSLLELAMSWLLAKPAVVSVIAGATTPEQVKANAAAVNWKLTSQE